MPRVIEQFPQGIFAERMAGDILETCAQMPVVIYLAELGGWLRDDMKSVSSAVEDGKRWTLARAFFHIHKIDYMRRQAYFQPIDYLRLDLPLPTSVNGLFVEAAGRKKGAGRQRVKTHEYKAWIDAAGWALKPQLTAQGAPIMPDTPTFGRHWALWIRLNVDHQGDVTNRIKALEDLLVAWRITVGDQWNDRCVVERDRTLDVDCRVIIYRKVQPCPDPASA